VLFTFLGVSAILQCIKKIIQI